MNPDLRVHAGGGGGGAGGQNLVHFQNEVFNPYLDNHLSESIQTWTRGTM